MGVVRSKCGLSSTLIMAPRAWMRSIMCTPSIIDRVARSGRSACSSHTCVLVPLAYLLPFIAVGLISLLSAFCDGVLLC
jgi:hypothetical protein